MEPFARNTKHFETDTKQPEGASMAEGAVPQGPRESSWDLVRVRFEGVAVVCWVLSGHRGTLASMRYDAMRCGTL